MNGPTTANLALGPRRLERRADAGFTLVAGVDGDGSSKVDGGGLIEPGAAGDGSVWSLDWWIGADDRWHVPAREPSVRQRRIGHGPVVETAVRVPSGDVTSTVYPAMAGGRPVTVVEVANESPVPVALAMAVRPYGLDGRPGPDPLRLVLDDEVVLVDGYPAMVLPRRPNEAGAVADGDLFDVVDAGGELSWPGEVAGPSANAVCLFPLPHRTSLRFVVLADADTGSVDGVSPGAVPDAESVARGWSSVVDRAARFEFPDEGVAALAGAARARLILGAADLGQRLVGGEPGAGVMLQGLAEGGHRVECRQALDAVAKADLGTQDWSRSSGDAGEASSTVAAIGLAAELLASASDDDDHLIDGVLEVAVHLTTRAERADATAVERARFGLAKLAAAAGQPDAAAKLVDGTGHSGIGVRLRRLIGGRIAQTSGAAGTGQDPAQQDVDDRGDALADLTAEAERASAAGSWADDDPAEAARFWIDARRMLLVERPGMAGTEAGTVIELLPGFPTAWLGGQVEVHKAPVAGFEVSFAIRWHGYRPALLWEITGGGSGDGPVDSDAAAGQGPVPRLVCPSLDPSWSSIGRSGETLLAGTGTELPPAPDPGQSFQ